MIKERYRVSGRYKNGSEVTHYRLMRSDGEQIKCSREKVIMMISKGLIENMRLQVRNESDIIIRGKGININDLPVIKENRCSAEEARCTDKVMATRRIMRGTKCIGYEVVDSLGNKKALAKKDIQRMASENKVANMEISKYNDSKSGEIKVYIRGKGCNLLELPIIAVDNAGRVISDTNNLCDTCRAIFVRSSGIIEDRKDRRMIRFPANSFIIYGVDGKITVETVDGMKSKYTIDRNSEYAASDVYMHNCGKYLIKLTSGEQINMEASKVKEWTIIKKK